MTATAMDAESIHAIKHNLKKNDGQEFSCGSCSCFFYDNTVTVVENYELFSPLFSVHFLIHYGEYDILPFGSSSKRRATSERKQKT